MSDDPGEELHEPSCQMYDDRRIMFQEGQRQLAIQLLGTVTDALNIEGE